MPEFAGSPVWLWNGGAGDVETQPAVIRDGLSDG